MYVRSVIWKKEKGDINIEMNKEEIKHFKSLLRQGSLRHMNILLDDKFQKELLNIIKDYEQLQNNWNELKEWLEEQYLRSDDYSDYETAFIMTSTKMQEIESRK